MSNSSKPANNYARFIPGEELQGFAAWKPNALRDKADPAPPPKPPEPTADEWRAQIAAARQAGYQDGYRDGLVALEGFKQSFATQATAQIGALLEGFDAAFSELDQRIAGAVAATAVQLARQVLRSEIEARPERVARVATEAVNAVLLSARHITVQVHPHDLPLVAEGAEEALAARGARLIANPGIERGGVLVESDVGAIDARIASRWAQAAQALGVDEAWNENDATEEDR
ncbi:MAG: flagellar assembly protein FliH [Burkholderiales bacterium]|nr:flagellar assembly protein FliH [Burkholderiales bacterium]